MLMEAVGVLKRWGVLYIKVNGDNDFREDWGKKDIFNDGQKSVNQLKGEFL